MYKKKFNLRKISYIFIFFSFFIFFLGGMKFLKKRNKSKLKKKHLFSFDTSEFFKTINTPPIWMKDKLKSDFTFFYDKKITDKKINSTINQLNTYNKDVFVRVKIINGQIFILSYSKKELTESFKGLFWVFNFINKKLKKLPNVDFLISWRDGHPELYQPNNLFPKDGHIMQNPSFQAPIFAASTLENINHIILLPDFLTLYYWESLYQEITQANETVDYQWKNKIDKALWRGAPSDKYYSMNNYKTKPRYILSTLSKNHPKLIDAGYSCTLLENGPIIEKLIIEEGLLINHMSKPAHIKYKYLPTLDGYMCTWPGYIWRLLSTSVTFKQESDEIQWFYNALKPYEHYVPIKNDMSDLVEKIMWAKENDDLCKKISQNATEFIKNNMRVEHIYAHLFLILKEYASTQEDMNWKVDEEWIHFIGRKEFRRKNKIATIKKLLSF